MKSKTAIRFPKIITRNQQTSILNISTLHVDTTEPEEDIDVQEELSELRKLQAERDEIEARMDEHLGVLGYE